MEEKVSNDYWMQLIKKAKGADVGFIALLLFYLVIISALGNLNDDIFKLSGMIAIGLISLMAFNIYSKKKKSTK